MATNQTCLGVDDLVDVLDLLKRLAFPKAKWYDLGLSLGLRKDTLDDIEKNYPRDVSRCMTECLSKWLGRADNVDSRGGANLNSLSDALRSMNETAAAEKLKHQVLIDIFDRHTVLFQSLCDPVSIAWLLNAECMLTQEVVSRVVSASPSIPNQREALLTAVKEAVQTDPNSLHTFANVMCKISTNTSLGQTIQDDISKYFPTPEVGVVPATIKDHDVVPQDNTITNETKTIKSDTSPSDAAVFSNSSFQPLSPQVEVHVPVSKGLLGDFRSMRMSYGRMIFNVGKIIKRISPPLEEIKDLISCCSSDLRQKAEQCTDLFSALRLIQNECSLTDIALLHTVVEEMEITEAASYIEAYRTELTQFCKSLSITLCLKERFVSIPHLQCETVTLVLDWEPKEHVLEDIKEILAKVSGKLLKIQILDSTNSICVTCSFPFSDVGFTVLRMIENIHILMGQGLKKLTIGSLTLWRRQDVRQKELKEKDQDLLQHTEVISYIVLEEAEYKLKEAISSKKKETIELIQEIHVSSIAQVPEEESWSVQSDTESIKDVEEEPFYEELTVLRSQFNEIKEKNKELSDKLSKMKVDHLRSLSNLAASKMRRGMSFEIDDCKFHLEAMTRPDYQPLVDNERIIEKLQERITLMNTALITERENNEKIIKDIKLIVHQKVLEDETHAEKNEELTTLQPKMGYDKNMAEKEVEVAYSRIMLLGSAGVGKTCFTRSLMKEKYQSDTDSTIISDVKSVRPIDMSPAEQQDDVNTTIKSPSDEPHYKLQLKSHNRSVQFKSHMLSENKKWKQVDENDEIDEVAYLIAAVYDEDSGSEDLCTAVAALLLYKIESPFCPSDFSDQKIHREEVDSFLAKAIKRAQEIGPVPIQDIKPQPFMHIWDCGGQAVFLEILPAFLSSRTMFFLLFNAAKSLDEKWKNIRSKKGNTVCDEVESISTKDLLFNWMANIYHHLAQLDEKGAFLSYPRIYCIGTHGDQINHDEQRAAIEKMKSTYKNKAFSFLIKKVLIVDNTTAGSDEEDPTFSIIREEVSDFTCNKLIVKTPVSWVLFRKVIKMLGKKVISLKEAHKIGLACKIPLNDVPKVLLFYHDLGVLLYYPFIKGLQDRVIINPQWFVDTLGKVFTLEGRENQNATEAMWSLLREKGILVEPLYREVWGDCCKEISPDDLMELLVYFCLAAEVKTDQFFMRNAKQYFLPAVLKSHDTSSPQSSCNYKPVARATNLHITFSTDFVPPGFFTRLIASLAKISSCKICFEEGVFRNRIVFKFGTPSVNQVTFTDLCTTIQVSAERFSDAPNITPFSNTCQELKNLLEKCGNEVDIALGHWSDLSKSIEISRKLYYECTACDGYEPHYISLASGQTANFPLCCQKRKNYRQPTPEESYWFPEEEQIAENVPFTISEKEMVVISKQVGDKAAILAACMEMLQKFKALQQNPAYSNDPMLHLLYEWKIGGGYREDLIEALKCADLHQLADQVKVSDYRPASGRLSVVNFRQSTNEQCSDFDPFQDVEDIQTRNKDSTHEITKAGVKATKDSGQLTDLYTNQRHQEISEASRDIKEDDLLRSSKFFDAKKIKKFVKICDDDSGYLQSVMNKYQHSDTQTIAFQVLRAMVKKNPNITKENLKRKLHLMKFEEAANNLSEPSQFAQATRTTSTEATPRASQPAQSNSTCLVL